jgi:hypothetical protein
LREGEARNEQEILYLPPATCLVLHEIKVRRLVVADGVHLVFVFTSAFPARHSPATRDDGGSLQPLKYGAVSDGVADARLLAFELKPKPALSRRNQMKAEA